MVRCIPRVGSFLLGVMLAFNLASCVVAEPSSLDERKQAIMDIESHATADAIERKGRSEAKLRAEGVPVNDFLPAIEGESQAKRRSVDEVAYRTMALLVVALKGEGLEQPDIERIVGKYRLSSHFSPNERGFIEDPNPSEHERVQFSWRYESACVLLWALGYVDRLGMPTASCDVPAAVSIMRERSVEQFLADARLRPLPEILDQADLIYRYHWAVVDARINGRPPPVGLDADVTMERHYALNWLIGYLDQEWDDISTDT